MGFLGYQVIFLFVCHRRPNFVENIVAYKEAVKRVYVFDKIILFTSIFGIAKFARFIRQWQETGEIRNDPM